jgi:hypothetical protein
MPGESGQWEWRKNAKRIAGIAIDAEAERITLSYRWSGDGREWHDAKQVVQIARSPCRLGGERHYFLCAGHGDHRCGRHVKHLYGGRPHFLCRHCCGLAYASQSEAAADRALRKLDKIRLRLGDQRVPQRPKGMWRRTYEKLCQQLDDAEGQAEEAFFLGWRRRKSPS